jgi:hypothetical protein
MISKRFGLNNTLSYSDDMLVFEMFVVIVYETLISSVLSMVAVFCVVSLITGSGRIGFVVVGSVLLVYLGLTASIPLQGLTFNNVIIVHLVSSLGISVLYSAHISLSYLIVEAPLEYSDGR